MILNTFSKTPSQIVFSVDNSLDEFIIVELNGDKEQLFKQETKAEFFLSILGEEISWEQIDREMARINKIKIHFV